MSKYFYRGFLSNVQKSSKRSLWRLRCGNKIVFHAKEIVYHPPSREEELKNIEHSMSMAVDTKASNFRNKQCLRVHVWFIVTIYYKTRQLFFWQNISGVLLQNTTVITKCIDFISRWESYYKMRRILQNASEHKVYLVALHEFPYCWDKWEFAFFSKLHCVSSLSLLNRNTF